MRTIPEWLKGHVSLEVECVDRVYLNGYIPTLQTSGALIHFLEQHRGEPIGSPALLGQMTQTFVAEGEAYAQANNIPLVRFEKGQRKNEVAAEYRRCFSQSEGIVFIGVAQERVNGFKARKDQQGKMVRFFFSWPSVYVKNDYIYLQDAQFGPGFIKIATYAPYPVKICLNGCEEVKQQLRQAEIDFTALDNGFANGEDPNDYKRCVSSEDRARFKPSLINGLSSCLGP